MFVNEKAEKPENKQRPRTKGVRGLQWLIVGCVSREGWSREIDRSRSIEFFCFDADFLRIPD